jgi:predicted MPP superfamily phosphohydrolase
VKSLTNCVSNDARLQSLRLIHLSDLHLGERNTLEASIVLDTLVKDVNSRLSQWNLANPYIAISGDLTFAGRKEEYKLVDDFFGRLSDKLKPAGFVFCPGNHDLNWSDHPRSNSDLMEDLVERGTSSITRVDKRFEHDHDREELRTGMSNYYEFLAKHGVVFNSYLYSLSSIVAEQFKVNFIGLNSAYLFCSKYSYYGYVGMPQLERAFNEASSKGNLPDDFRVFNISLVHHPFQAIVPASQIETENLTKSRSDVILNGHVHNLRVYLDLTASLIGARNTRSHPVISGARCVYDEVNDPHIVPGYSILDLQFEGNLVKRIEIYEIHYDKTKEEWLADPNNPNLDIPLPLVARPVAAATQIPKLSVITIEDAFGWGWSPRRLLDEIVQLDRECIPEMTSVDEGTPSQWLPIRMQHPDTMRIIIDKPESLSGYWSFVPLFDSDFKLAKEGKLVESELTADRIPEFELGGRYHMYFVMMALKPQFRHCEAIHALYHSFFNTIEDLAEKGVFFDEVVTNAYTPNGVGVCKSLGMQFLTKHVNHGDIYWTKLYPLPNIPAVKEHPKLSSLYASEFGTND